MDWKGFVAFEITSFNAFYQLITTGIPNKLIVSQGFGLSVVLRINVGAVPAQSAERLKMDCDLQNI